MLVVYLYQGLEMTQNSIKLSWSAEVDEKLKKHYEEYPRSLRSVVLKPTDM